MKSSMDSFLPIFFAALFLFLLILELVDLFGNIVRYLNNNATINDIILSVFLFMPKCISYAVPLSMLFAISYTLGMMHANNELIIVYGSGIQLPLMLAPIFSFAILLSIGGFFLDDAVVLPAQKTRIALLRKMTGQTVSLSKSEVTLIGRGKSTVWHADFYDDTQVLLSGIIVIKRTENGMFTQRIDANQAVWTDGRWLFKSVKIFTHDMASGAMSDSYHETWSDENLVEPPESFKSRKGAVEELGVIQARDYVAALRASGLPYTSELSEYYKRFAFSLTPLVVVLLSTATAGRFRKNVLLMSLLFSLLSATGYYVFQMITMLLAKTGEIPPLVGAFLPVTLFMIGGIGFVSVVKN